MRGFLPFFFFFAMMWLVLGPYTLLVKLKLLHCGWQEKLCRYLANLVRWIISLYRLIQIIYSNLAYPHYGKHVRFRTERETLFQFLKWFVFTSCRMCSVSHACLERERERERERVTSRNSSDRTITGYFKLVKMNAFSWMEILSGFVVIRSS